MKQKLLIILALVRKPSILVMDEPAASLDALSRARFYSLLEELPQETIVLMSSHRVDEISNLVNRVVELDDGRVVLDDIMSTQLSADVEFRLSFTRVPKVIEEGLRAWGFSKVASSDDKLFVWQGRVPAPDKFRFVATLTRWSGLIVNMEMHESEGKKGL